MSISGIWSGMIIADVGHIWLLVGLVRSLESLPKKASSVLLCVRISVTSQAQLAAIHV